MRTFFLRLRGIVGTGIVWSIPWGLAAGLSTGAFTYVITPVMPGASRIGLAASVAGGLGALGALMGFGAGVLFSVVIMVAEGSHRLEGLRMKNFVAWGACAGAILSVALAAPLLGSPSAVDLAVLFGSATVLGALCGAGSLALARRGARARTDPVEGEGVHGI